MFVDEKKQGESQVDAVGRILLDAADHIEKFGWCQHRLTDGYSVCMMGALYASVKEDPHGKDEMRKSYSRLSNFLKSDVSVWNDVRGRTQKEAVRALREAAYVC